MNFNFAIAKAILRKDLLSLYPLVLLTAALFAGDVFITRLELLPLWASFQMPLLLLASVVLILSVFQLDSPVSLTDDWLCRPVPKRELLVAKLLLVLAVIYLSRVLATFIADLMLGASLIESLQEAVMLQDVYFQLLLPILLITAVVTTSLIQGIGVLVALFVCIFMIPTPLIQPPGPLEPGIGEGIGYAGLSWLVMVPAKTASLLLVPLVYWLVYRHKRIKLARALLVATAGIIVLLVVLPMYLLPWHAVFSLQKATLAKADTVNKNISDSIHLRAPRTCFPATRLGNLASDAAFSAARQFSGLSLWRDEDLRVSGADSLAFLTGVEAAPVPPDWRVKLSYVQADYEGSDGHARFSLRPAAYITDNGGGSLLSHAWVLPENAVQQLKAQPDTALKLTYSLTLLKPRNYTLATDGKRHALPGYGYCSAKVDSFGNSIAVDCFSASHQGAQLSAELNGIPASRTWSLADFAPDWTRLAHSERIKLAIASPRLAKHDTITVTAWDVADQFDKSLTLPGILGAAVDICPLPTRDDNKFQQSRWHDAAPHESYSISVDEGVQLEVLDFGGQGSPILLLPGLGATAHTFDDFAPLLTRHHRVIAMTRRGTGYSSKPDFGFDTERLGGDVVQVMDAMKLPQALLVGSSIAGDEMTWLGAHHADRFTGLVYLDAAYDRSGDPTSPTSIRMRELNRSLPPSPPIPPSALANYEAMTAFIESRGDLRYPEGELIALLNVNNPFIAGAPSIDQRTQEAITAAITTAPDYAAVRIPALAIYAFPDPASPLPPWYDPNDRQLMANLDELAQIAGAIKRRSIDLFKSGMKQGQVLEMQKSRHMIYQSNPSEVLEAIEQFVAGRGN